LWLFSILRVFQVSTRKPHPVFVLQSFFPPLLISQSDGGCLPLSFQGKGFFFLQPSSPPRRVSMFGLEPVYLFSKRSSFPHFFPPIETSRFRKLPPPRLYTRLSPLEKVCVTWKLLFRPLAVPSREIFPKFPEWQSATRFSGGRSSQAWFLIFGVNRSPPGKGPSGDLPPSFSRASTFLSFILRPSPRLAILVFLPGVFPRALYTNSRDRCECKQFFTVFHPFPLEFPPKFYALPQEAGRVRALTFLLRFTKACARNSRNNTPTLVIPFVFCF